MNRRQFATISASSALGLSVSNLLAGQNDGWIDLMGGSAKGLEAFKAPTGYWKQTATVELDPASPRKLKWVETAENTGIWVNGPTGKTNNLVTRAAFGDVELKLEFNVPTGSNSGVKLQGLYEIQIFDSFGVPAAKFNASGMGGIYPRAELLPRYHHIDEGFPAKVNAAAGPVAVDAHCLSRAAFRSVRPKGRARPIRQGRDQRQNRSRKQNRTDADRPRLCFAGSRGRTDPSAGRSRAGRLPQRESAPSHGDASLTSPTAIPTNDSLTKPEPEKPPTMSATASETAVEYPKQRSMYVAGTWTEAIGGTRLDVINPADESVLASVAHGRRADADKAVAAAVQAFPAWSKTTAYERAKILKTVA